MDSQNKKDGHAAARLASLLDSAMDAIITVDASHRVILYNRAAEKVFGWPAKEILGQPLNRLIPERLRGQHDQHVSRFAATGVTSRRMSGSSVVYGLRADGEEFPVDASISQVDTPEGKLFTVILRDVTDRMESQKEQARMAARLSGLLDSAMDGIITVDEGLRIILYNRAAERIFGWPPLQVMGRTLDMLMPKRYRAGHSALMRQFGSGDVPSRRMGAARVIHGMRANGEEFPIEASISQLDSPEGKLYTVILRDVTERQQAQQELAALANEAIGAREEEKARIARELHDELAQSLAAIRMDALQLRDGGELPQAAAEQLQRMIALIDGAVASTRRIAADLRPLVLDDLGLESAIEWLAENFTQRNGVPCTLDVQDGLDVGEPYATAVFRSLQEALANVAKHARATNVDVGAAIDGDEVVVSVRDNGAGFDMSGPRKPQSLGLAGMRERARLLRGMMRIESTVGAGTFVEVRLPIGGAQSS